MRVIRFMSSSEASALFIGNPIINKSKHDGFQTNSVGFCFFESAPADDETYQAARLLSGIADLSYCIVGTLNTAAQRRMKRGRGRYFDHDTSVAFMHDELSATEYGLDDFDEFTFYRADFEACPILFSGSWLKPDLVEQRNKNGAVV